MVSWTRLSVKLHVHCLSCWKSATVQAEVPTSRFRQTTENWKNKYTFFYFYFKTWKMRIQFYSESLKRRLSLSWKDNISGDSSSCERGSVTSIFTKGDVLERRDSSVGIATRYGPDGPGIKSRWGRDFPAPVQTDPGAHSDPYTRGTGHVTEGKAAGALRSFSIPSSTEVKERIELYIYSPFSTFIAGYRVEFTL